MLCRSKLQGEIINVLSLKNAQRELENIAESMPLPMCCCAANVVVHIGEGYGQGTEKEKLYGDA